MFENQWEISGLQEQQVDTGKGTQVKQHLCSVNQISKCKVRHMLWVDWTTDKSKLKAAQQQRPQLHLVCISYDDATAHSMNENHMSFNAYEVTYCQIHSSP